MSDRGRLGVLVATAGVLVATVLLTLSWAGEKRRFVASAPQPAPLYETEFIKLNPNRYVCLEGATAVPRGNLAEFRISTNGRRAEPLSFGLIAKGYRGTGKVPATYRDNDVLSVRVQPPPEPRKVRACIRNDGDRPVDVFAAADESPTLDAGINGEDIDSLPVVRLLEADRGTVSGHAGEIAEQITVFRPPFVGTWRVWPLGVLLVLGLPLGIGWTLWRALGEREP